MQRVISQYRATCVSVIYRMETGLLARVRDAWAAVLCTLYIPSGARTMRTSRCKHACWSIVCGTERHTVHGLEEREESFSSSIGTACMCWCSLCWNNTEERSCVVLYCPLKMKAFHGAVFSLQTMEDLRGQFAPWSREIIFLGLQFIRLRCVPPVIPSVLPLRIGMKLVRLNFIVNYNISNQ